MKQRLVVEKVDAQVRAHAFVEGLLEYERFGR
jgi:hypothetical protein